MKKDNLQAPVISVITPVFNGENYIEQCILNFLSQDCAYAEQIIIDGGSSDKTVKIIGNYATNHPSIRWISEKDKGQSDAMNKGISLARGRIVSFLNVDDIYEPFTLRKVFSLVEEIERRRPMKPYLIVGNCNIYDDNEDIKAVCKPKDMRYESLLMGWDFHPIPVNPTSYFYCKDIHEEIGFYLTEEHYMLDWDFILKAVKVAKVYYVDEVFGGYRYIKGTKTFEDDASGAAKNRRDKFLKRHRESLSGYRKVYFYCSFAFKITYAYVKKRVDYFWKYPGRFPRSVLKLLSRILRSNQV